MQRFTVGETPVEIARGIWLTYADGVMHVENKTKPREDWLTKAVRALWSIGHTIKCGR